MTVEYSKEKDYVQKNGLRAKNGCLDEIIAVKKVKYGFTDDIDISKKILLSRITRCNFLVHGIGAESRMVTIESQLVELIVRMSRIRQCITSSQCLHLANDPIKGTLVEK